MTSGLTCSTSTFATSSWTSAHPTITSYHRRVRRPRSLLIAGALVLTISCGRPKQKAGKAPGSLSSTSPASPTDPAKSGAALPPRPARPALPKLDAGAGEAYVYDAKTNAATTITDAGARAAGLLVVDLGDGWAPFIFQDGGIEKGDPPKPNGYRQTFIDLANDRVDSNGHPIANGDHNFLEPFGIPPTLSVLRARVEDDLGGPRVACESRVDGAGLSTFTGNVGYVDRERARRDHVEAMRDGDWLDKEIARRELAASSTTETTRADATVPDAGPLVPRATWTPGDRTAAIAALRGDANARLSARVDRAARGQERIRAVRAAQARLTCEGLLSPRARFASGMFDLPTHEALASWERKNDVFGWAFLGGETLSTLSRSPLDLDLEAFRRVLAERMADAAGIVEDGSAAKWKESSGSEPVRNLIAEHVTALLASLHVATPVEMAEFLRQHGPDGLATLRVAFRAPALPAYYGPHMDLSVEIDRGDVWYDFPFDPKGRPVEQAREHFPHLTLFVSWRGQKIPLCQWRTTVGSWRSELHENGKIYYKYKNSDVGPRVWKHIVAGPVWIPPDATPVKDLLIRKVLDRDKGPEWVVNTDVMGPGFQSAYGSGHGHPHKPRRIRQPDSDPRLGRLHVDRAPVLARVSQIGERPRRAPVRFHIAPPAVSARRLGPVAGQASIHRRRRPLFLRAEDARVLLRAAASDRDHRR